MDDAAFVYCDLFDTYVITQDHELYTFGCIGGSGPKQIASDVVDISTSSAGISILTTDNKIYIGTVSESYRLIITVQWQVEPGGLCKSICT